MVSLLVISTGLASVLPLGVLDGPVGEMAPYAGAAGILGLVMAAAKFLRDFQVDLLNPLRVELKSAREEAAEAKAEAARATHAVEKASRRDTRMRAAMIALADENRSLRAQLGLEERRHRLVEDLLDDETIEGS